MNSYNQLVARYPVVGKSLTAGVLVAAGDLIAQVFFDENYKKEGKGFEINFVYFEIDLFFSSIGINFTRTLKMSCLGFFFTGPGMHVWYKFLNSRIPGSSNTDVFKKIFFDQIFFGPLTVSGK